MGLAVALAAPQGLEAAAEGPQGATLPLDADTGTLRAAMRQGELPAPQGRALLTVSGAIARTNAEGRAVLDAAMLRALGGDSFETETIWTPGRQRFTGVRLKTLLEALGAEGTMIEALAINDYQVEIPVSDATEDGPIIAYEMDGAPMSRRSKGPLWLIYPFSSSSDYRTEVIYSRSIWQLDRMILRP